MKREEIFQALSDFRKGFLQILITLVLIGMALFPFSKTLLRYLYESNLKVDVVAEPNSKIPLVAFAIPEAFFSLLKLTLYASLFLSIPVIFYQAWKSFIPLFRFQGWRSSLLFFLASLILFYLGSFFCYFVTLPFGVKFLLGYQSAHIEPRISVARFISFCALFIFGFGFTFELPLILALLSYLKVINAAFLSRNRKYAILLIAIVAAVVTPTPDPFNMGLMGVPLYLLFEIGVILVRLIERKRARTEIPVSKIE